MERKSHVSLSLYSISLCIQIRRGLGWGIYYWREPFFFSSLESNIECHFGSVTVVVLDWNRRKILILWKCLPFSIYVSNYFLFERPRFRWSSWLLCLCLPLSLPRSTWTWVSLALCSISLPPPFISFLVSLFLYSSPENNPGMKSV